MKNILGLIFITCSLNTHALTCTSTSQEPQKSINVLEKEEAAILLEIDQLDVKTYMLGSSQTDTFFDLKYVVYDHFGIEHVLTISMPIQHCRTRVCNSNPFATKIGVLSSTGLANEYFNCF